MTNVLLVGEAAREHALAEAICRSNLDPKLYSVMRMKNPGISALCKKTKGEAITGESTDPETVVGAAKKFAVDLVVVGPEEPLFHGVADRLDKAGIPCVGARKGPAEIEMSKAFMRRLMWKHRIPGRLRFKAFTHAEDAVAYLKEYAESVALKPARQAGGKGVKVVADFQAYLSSEKAHVKEEHTHAIFERHMKDYTDIEDRILIEERVEGPEYTVQTFTDGRTVKALPLVQDNKNAYEMDIGPETGGMGSIAGRGALLPFITQREYDESVEIVEKTVKAIGTEVGERYKGVISGQMMLTPLWGPTIIEFYSRLGDPEAVNVIPILRTDFIELCEAIVEEKLGKLKLELEPKATVVKCVSPKGYPERRDLARGHPLQVDVGAIERRGCKVYYASTEQNLDGAIITGGSRAVEILGVGESIPEAAARVEASVPCVRLGDGWGLFHRVDIGSEPLLQRRIAQAQMIREVYGYRRRKGLVGRSIDWIPGRGRVEYIS